MPEAQPWFFLFVLGIRIHNAFELAGVVPSERACQSTSILSFKVENRSVMASLCIKLHK